MWFYQIFRWIGVITGYPFNWLVFSRKVYYESGDSVGKKVKGGALIIENHYSPFDYVQSVFQFFPRMLYVVASEHAYKNPLISFGMKFWGGIKVDRRTRSLRFVDQSAEKIKNGDLVLIFPEGHNTPDGTIKKFYPSYVKIALLSKAPIIPVISDGSYGLFKRLHLIIGDSIDVYDYLETEEYTREDIYRINELVHGKVLQLREELDRRIQNDRMKRKVNSK